MDPRYGKPPVPRLPLFEKPRCKGPSCGAVCELYPRAPNRARPFWKCPEKTCGKWCTFDDLVGIVRENPLCDCGFYCRKAVSNDGRTFETCAFGKCDMLRYKAQLRESSPAAMRHVSPAGPSSPTARRPVPTASSGAASLDNGFDSEFIRLLRHVLAVVNQTSFPTRVTDMSDEARSKPGLTKTDSENPPPAPFQLQSSTEFERHAKVGAAGELFVSRSRLATQLGSNIK